MSEIEGTAAVQRVSYRRTLDYWLLWLLVLILLAFNAYLVRMLLVAKAEVDRIRVEAAGQVLDVAEQVAALRTTVIRYDVVINEDIPINMAVPIDMTVPIDIEEDIFIDTTVTTRLLGVPVDVPIAATVPVAVNTEVPINETITINETIPIAVDVPIEIDILQTPLAEMLAQAYDQLIDFAAQLDAGAVVGALPEE